MAERRLAPPWITLRLRFAPVSLRLDRRAPKVALALALFALLIVFASILYGAYDMTPLNVWQTLTGTLPADHPQAADFNLVVHTFRLPRILTAFFAGAALAVAGAIMQGIMRNPLAEPGTLGVTAGAGVAAVALITRMVPLPLSLLPWAALAGGLAAAFAVYLLAFKRGGATPVRLILIGVAVASMLHSLITLMLVFAQITDVQLAYVWLSGSVYGASWADVRALGLWLLILLPPAFFSARSLNALGLGDEVARGFGVAVERQRALLLGLSAVLTGAAVSAVGTIAFVGLIAPHITRRLVGPAHEALLPMSALLGGVLLVLADLIGRWVLSPSELPVGVVTALIGAPYFLILLVRSRKRAERMPL